MNISSSIAPSAPVGSPPNFDAQPHPRRLTPRELQIATLVTYGRTNKDIARQLGISPRTVEVHRSRIMLKLAVRNTAELVRFMLAHWPEQHDHGAAEDAHASIAP